MTTKDLRVGMVIRNEKANCQIISRITDTFVYARTVLFDGTIENDEFIAYDFKNLTFEKCSKNAEVTDMNTIINNYLALA